MAALLVNHPRFGTCVWRTVVGRARARYTVLDDDGVRSCLRSGLACGGRQGFTMPSFRTMPAVLGQTASQPAIRPLLVLLNAQRLEPKC